MITASAGVPASRQRVAVGRRSGRSSSARLARFLDNRVGKGGNALSFFLSNVSLVLPIDGHNFFPFKSSERPPAPQPVVIGKRSLMERPETAGLSER